jgi:hypothetical protein
MNLNLSRKELESAPHREGWQEPTEYESIYLLHDGKHDSGYALICIVGRKSDGSLEKAAWCDDICWKHSGKGSYTMRTDMCHPSRVVHCWGWDTTFRVGASLSSTDVEVFS